MQSSIPHNLNQSTSSTRNKLTESKRIVIKIGTSSLTHSNGKLNLRRIERLSQVLCDLKNRGKDIILVTSGAIAAGADRLGMPERPRDTRGKQAASAVGQAILMRIYESFFMSFNQRVAQILLTRDVFTEPERRTNARNTFDTLFSLDVISIVNENDTVSTDELGFSENDSLSAYVACLIDADLLILLTDRNGFYDSDPKNNPNAELIQYMEEFSPQLEALAGGSSTSLGSGGMSAKISAAKMAHAQGITTVIASGSEPDTLYDILDGKDAGTLIVNKKYES